MASVRTPIGLWPQPSNPQLVCWTQDNTLLCADLPTRHIHTHANSFDPHNHTTTLTQGPDIAIHHPESVLDKMNDWCKEHHHKSGLVQRVRDSKVSLREAEQQVSRSGRWVAVVVVVRTGWQSVLPVLVLHAGWMHCMQDDTTVTGGQRGQEACCCAGMQTPCADTSL